MGGFGESFGLGGACCLAEYEKFIVFIEDNQILHIEINLLLLRPSSAYPRSKHPPIFPSHEHPVVTYILSTPISIHAS